MATLEQLQAQIKDFTDRGLSQLVRGGVVRAQADTMNYIRRTYPAAAFGGKPLPMYIQRGKHGQLSADNYGAVVYANYFARWYNTGAAQHVIKGHGPRAGQRSAYYPARGNYFGANKSTIETYFSNQLVKYVKTGGLFK
nr:MAG TPA: hypothetical protein [Bacteriophage sp.]